MSKNYHFQQVRKIKPTRMSVSGHLPFKDGVSIPYESTLERDFLMYFTYLPIAEDIIPQPIRLSFTKNGITYPYTPDFFVRFNDDRKSMLIEVKPKAKWQAHWHEWKQKWKAAMKFCKQNDCVFHIYDEDKIRHLALFNINAVQRYKRLLVEKEDVEAILSQVRLMEITTIDYLLTRFFSGSLYRAKGLQVIYHLLATKQLTCNWFEPLSEFTQVWSYNNE
ncbi:TnsA endonuclease N-terminal domain-containing protein [Caviibacterium pharyngocola]|uniref:Heteromeric transposase endonuclease subunit TnsA n=1 Tax=Caviibacterium pharyngocola TaxID=28159 RepID=A0A2M8RU22_9PAST|nr:TnsA endonuclease N-terminal domain-containing protein [Caviibacterium pharyngocola]PJG82382.1 heteromeric transposase endonuclease subunit TnsA [Caviibacterium pharyngocola]